MRSIRQAVVFSALFVVAAAAAGQNVWTTHGPTGIGMVYDVTVGASAAWAGTPNGVFRSTDGALTWQPSGLVGETIIRILAPSDFVVLALVASLDSRGSTLYASRDDGASWARIPGLPVLIDAAFDPWHSTLYAGAKDGSIWRSTDAGSSWQRVSRSPTGSWVNGFAFDSFAVYMQSLEASNNTYALYRSTDGGVSWAVVQTPLPSPSAFAGGAAPGVIYAAAYTTAYPGLDPSVCRSADSAATWTCSSIPSLPHRFLELPQSVPGASSRLLAACQDDVFVSGDQGATWSPAGLQESNGSLASDASGSLVIAGGFGGISRSEDRGDSWTSARAGLQNSSIHALALDPQNASTIWAADDGLDETSGLFRSLDEGLSWSPAGGPGGPIAAYLLAIDPRHPSTLYAADSTTVYRSDDSGEHWTSNTDGHLGAYALAVDPASSRVWFSTGNLFRSDDQGRTFQSGPIAQGVYSLLFDSKHTGTMYAGSYFDLEPTFYGPYPEGGSIFVSYDSGATFAKKSRDFGSAVTAIATDPLQDGVLYAGTYYTGVFRSADAGTTWEAPDAKRPAIGYLYSLVADPIRPNVLYAATDLGVFRTVDAARTWNQFSSGLGYLPVGPLVVSPDGKRLHAGTVGGGVFELDLDAAGSGQPCLPNASHLCLVGNRYAVELLASSRTGDPLVGTTRALGDRSGYFSLPFATGDFDLPEVVVKMLPDGTFGNSGAPIFSASLTTLPYALTVTDTVTGQVAVYNSDPDAPLCGAASLFQEKRAAASPRAAPVAGETDLQLLGGRFSVTLEARDRSGRPMEGFAMASGDEFGIFSLPDVTGDPQFPEVAVKMVDARSFTGEFWFFHSSLTDLDYVLTVTDSVTGATRTYESTAPFCGVADTSAFADAPPSPSRIDLNGSRSGTISWGGPR